MIPHCVEFIVSPQKALPSSYFSAHSIRGSGSEMMQGKKGSFLKKRLASPTCSQSNWVSLIKTSTAAITISLGRGPQQWCHLQSRGVSTAQKELGAAQHQASILQPSIHLCQPQAAEVICYCLKVHKDQFPAFCSSSDLEMNSAIASFLHLPHDRLPESSAKGFLSLF